MEHRGGARLNGVGAYRRVDALLSAAVSSVIWGLQEGGSGLQLAQPCWSRDARRPRERRRRLWAWLQAGESADRPAVRVADVVIVWNVLEHFYPDFDVSGVDWRAVLPETLGSALRDRTSDQFFDTLRHMVARLDDGHGVVFYKRKVPIGGLPVRTEWIENQVVITATSDHKDFRRGDVIVGVDGVEAGRVLAQEERYVSGTPWLRRYRALNQFGEGKVGSVAKLVLRRGGVERTVDVARGREARGLFFNGLSEFHFPRIKEVRPGILYLNLSIDDATFEKNLARLAAARGLIFDWRWDGTRREGKPLDLIDVISHLTTAPLRSEHFLVPEVIVPDREVMTFRENQWDLQPEAPHFPGKIVFIDPPAVVSFGETVMGIVKNHHLGTIVGVRTAGANGNVNRIPLPGGYRVMFTGMRVLESDGSPIEGVGIPPDVPVHRTIQGVIDGKDQYLATALQVLDKELGGS